MADTRRYPVVPADQEDEPLQRSRVARWIPILVPLLALLMVLLVAFLIGGVL